MGLAYTQFKAEDRAYVEIGGHRIEGTVHSSIHATDALMFFIPDEGIEFWISASYAHPVGMTPEQAWEALKLGDVFDFEGEDDGQTRVKVTATKYVLLGQNFLHTPPGDLVPVKRED